MHQASVGFHCPECVAQEHTRVVHARGLRPDQPVLTITLMAINVAVWIIGQLVWKPTSFFTTSDGAIRVGALYASGIQVEHGRVVGGLLGVGHGEWYRLLSAGFVHANIIHLAVNMWALYVLGRVTETLLGRTRTGLIYFVSLFAGSLGALVASPDSVTVGASGAIFGLMGGLLAVAKARGVALRDTGLLGVLVINLLLTFGLSSYISVGAHVGGLIGGAIAGLVVVDLPNRLRRADRRTRAVVTWAGGIGLCVVFFVAGIIAGDHAAAGKVYGIAAGWPVPPLRPPR